MSVVDKAAAAVGLFLIIPVVVVGVVVGIMRGVPMVGGWRHAPVVVVVAPPLTIVTGRSTAASTATSHPTGTTHHGGRHWHAAER